MQIVLHQPQVQIHGESLQPQTLVTSSFWRISVTSTGATNGPGASKTLPGKMGGRYEWGTFLESGRLLCTSLCVFNTTHVRLIYIVDLYIYIYIYIWQNTPFLSNMVYAINDMYEKHPGGPETVFTKRSVLKKLNPTKKT